jgi:hypothetical protein
VIRRALLIVALAGLGCAPPRRALGSRDIAGPAAGRGSPDEAFGHQAIVTTKQTVFYGELIGCDAGDVYLLLNDVESPYVMVPWDMIERAEALSPGGAKAGTIVWTVLGGLSTISHGFWALVSGAVWAGTGAGSILWGIQHESVVGKCEDLRPYVRYPQGLPERIHVRYWGSTRGAPRREGTPFPGVPLPSAPGSSPSAPAPPSGAPEPLPVMPALPPSTPIPVPGLPPPR